MYPDAAVEELLPVVYFVRTTSEDSFVLWASKLSVLEFSDWPLGYVPEVTDCVSGVSNSYSA